MGLNKTFKRRLLRQLTMMILEHNIALNLQRIAESVESITSSLVELGRVVRQLQFLLLRAERAKHS